MAEPRTNPARTRGNPLLAPGHLPDGVLFLWGIIVDRDYTTIFRALKHGVLTTLWVTLVAFSLASLLGLCWR